MIQYPRRIDHLPPQILIIRMPDVQALRRERVRLHLDIRPRYFINKRTLPHVREPANDNRTSVRIYRRQTGQVLANLLQVRQISRLTFHDRCHSAERGAFELLATIKRVAVLHQPDVVLCDAEIYDVLKLVKNCGYVRTCRSNAARCLSAPRRACNGPYRTGRSLSPRRTGGRRRASGSRLVSA